MTDQTIVFSAQEGVATITLNRPEAMNALSPQMLAELCAALDRAAADAAVRVVVITGNGRAFCAGADLKSVGADVAGGGGSDVFLQGVKRMMDTVRSFPKPVIAGLNGITIAGGLEIAMCADIIVAAEGAKIGDGHLNFGVIPGAGGAAVLPRLVGPVIAKFLLFSGELLPAERLAHTGLLAAVWPQDRFAEALADLAAKVARKSPLGLRVTKDLVDRGLQASLEEALGYEIDANASYSKSYDMAEGLRAFAEKRSPVFAGR